MRVTDSIPVSTQGDSQMIDLTAKLQGVVDRHEIKHGQALVFVSGSTAGLTTVEYEPGLIQDIPEFFERVAPQDRHYHHQDTWHDGNGHSHVRASLLGPSITIPFQAGRLMLGTWQQLVLIDCDNRPRNRDIVVQLSGDD